jgi:2-dehydro-3-deoxy-D-arabinonate dehydratase
MHLYRTIAGTVLYDQGGYYAIESSWDQLVVRPGLGAYLKALIPALKPASDIDLSQPLLPPIGSQEVWAAGVTYFRSREARMEESKDAGGGSFYDKVYYADRPELFFKSMPSRVAGHRGEIRIRRDSAWNVPEPELTLFISSAGTIEGFTIGNDVSSRSIEGENPLYLPQAKTYQFSAALGPALYVPEPVHALGAGDASTEPGSEQVDMHHGGINAATTITLSIKRSGTMVFSGSTTLVQLKRRFNELAQWLFRETDFPEGVYLMTGTGIVPPDDFTLQSGDIVSISIDPIGTLVNTVGMR